MHPLKEYHREVIVRIPYYLFFIRFKVINRKLRWITFLCYNCNCVPSGDQSVSDRDRSPWGYCKHIYCRFFPQFYLKQPISLNLNKFEKNTPTEETHCLHILLAMNMKSEYMLCRSSPSKFNLPHPLKFNWQLNFSQKTAIIGVKNEVSLPDNFYSLVNVLHQYVFKYEILWKYTQLFKSYSTK